MLNQVQIIGYLGADPEVKTLQGGDVVANFSIATTEKWKDKQTLEPMEHTEWIRVSFFGRKAEVIQEFVRKGTLLYVSGKWKTRKWTDQAGIERYSTDVQGQEFKILKSATQRQEDEFPV
jgi:single-strand DNA-binding protein